MPLSADTIATHPSFLPSLSLYGERLAAVYQENQRLGANFGSQRRWLISQAALALYWGGDEGLTVNGLIDVLKPFKVASPNTIRDYVDESLAYGFLRPDPARASLRPRYFEPTPPVYAAIGQWIAANLSMLDALDAKGRVAAFAARPEMIPLMQPRLAFGCLRDAAWREPPPRVALLQKSISGGLVMDNIIVMVGRQRPQEGRYMIPALNAREMAKRILISRTHLQRILRKVVDVGAIGWSGRAFESAMWVDAAFIGEYCRWQAVKSHHLDAAFAFAIRGPADGSLPSFSDHFW
ncbi:hypothetical protein JET14_12750 [Martelella lutilitoris]|uniref:Uncharacterized protein n=1 Tax=Martelella lutilitoris TaxID=2583532 RepID=A0A7T7HHF1_9HYPH|nr:hypothetical protein [Martelella lutilitoris]QQM29202.1 hypothetical protein JET14_12750 [Martelella lutilitoris]